MSPARFAFLVIGAAAIALTGTVSAAQSDPAGALRASGQAGEQADGYLGLVGAASTEVRERVAAVNSRRHAYYADLAAKRGEAIEKIAATTACEILRTKVAPGQYYRLAEDVWRKRGAAPVTLPSYCG